MIVTNTRPKPCRFCGEPSWVSDEDGPLHPCCSFWIGVLGAHWCASCRTAKGLRAAAIRRQPPRRSTSDHLAGSARQ